jgi:hypothetical protein
LIPQSFEKSQTNPRVVSILGQPGLSGADGKNGEDGNPGSKGNNYVIQ